MLPKDDVKLEELLRSLPTAAPPDNVRRRVLAGARKPQHARSRWKVRLAWALCILALLCLDFTVQQVQSKRLSVLTQNTPSLSAPITDNGSLVAFLQTRADIKAMLENGEIR